jgi:citrate lyase beta subunit
LASPGAFQKAEVGAKRVYETKGVVRHLCATAKALRDSDPKFCRLVAADAVRIATRAQWPLLRADALVELGWAYVRLSKVAKADDVFSAAEQVLELAGQNETQRGLWSGTAVQSLPENDIGSTTH